MKLALLLVVGCSSKNPDVERWTACDRSVQIRDDGLISNNRTLVRTYADETISNLACDAGTIRFQRDEQMFTVDPAGTIAPSLDPPIITTKHLRVVSKTGDVRVAERDGKVIVGDRVLVAGHRPFPSLDGTTIYFRAEHEPTQLRAIPLAGGTPRDVATLGGRIVIGVDGPDGQHVMIDEPEHHLVSIRVRDGKLTDEGAHWVVPAPKGAWRYWQKPGKRFELRVIAPGKALGSMDCVFDADTRINTWTDEHHVAYGLGTAWHILDVRTCTDETPRITVIETGSPIDREAVMAPDGVHWFVSLPR